MRQLFDAGDRSKQIGVALAALGAAAAVHAQSTLYVDAAAPAGGDGRTWAAAVRDLQDALYLANLRPDRAQPIRINIAQGVYTPDAGTHNPSLSFVVNSGVSLAGGFAGALGANPDQNDPARFVSVLSGDLLRNDAPGNSTRTDNSQVVLDIRSQPGDIDGLTISGGIIAARRTGYGYFTISRCIFTGNVSSTLDPVVYQSPYNQTAILALSYATLVDCIVADNSSTILPLLNASFCRFQRCTIAGNQNVYIPTTPGLALGLGTLGSQCVLESCLIAANTGDTGLNAQSYDLALDNCTLADNRPGAGPILYGSGAAALTNCIFSRNGPSGPGSPPPQVSISNSVSIASSFFDHGASDVVSGIHSVSGAASILSGDPRFVSPAGPDADPLSWHDNDYRLAADSPCIDRADTTSVAYLFPHIDLAGNAPIDDPSAPNLGTGTITYLDLGAYEFIPAAACRADFNNSGTITIQDIFDFLSAWFASNPAADFDLSGAITVQDIFDFLSAWFAGCS